MKKIFFIIALFVIPAIVYAQEKPFRLAIAGLKHGHINGFLRNVNERTDTELVGIYDKDVDLSRKIADRFQLEEDIIFQSMDELLDQKPEAVAIFSSTFDHLELVRTCAKRKTDVMMEKPMAVNLEQAQQMVKIASDNNIELVVNYETTWYPVNYRAYEIKNSGTMGELTKVVVHSGHQGPKEIGVGPVFLEWLTDPVLNGGGAIMDFGCYGANLITWLMNNARPLTVTGITQQLKPEIYPRVDDEATIILTYPGVQGIIQASWNWPFNRKDMEVYFKEGKFMAYNRQDFMMQERGKEEQGGSIAIHTIPYADPVSYLKDVVRDKIENNGLSSPENNLIVMEILDAAKRSAKEGTTIELIKKEQ